MPGAGRMVNFECDRNCAPQEQPQMDSENLSKVDQSMLAVTPATSPGPLGS